MLDIQNQRKDEVAYLNGIYVLRAIGCAINGKELPYPDKPILAEQKAEKEQEIELTDEEKQRQIEQLFMQLQIMGGNFNRTHGKKADSE